MTRTLALIAVFAMVSVVGDSNAQVAMATVTTTANGGTSTTIALGGTVTVAVSIAHNQSSFAEIHGGSIIQGNTGIGGNFVTSIPTGPTFNVGSFTGGSRNDANIATLAPMLIGGWNLPPFNQNPMPVWQYQITGLLPGVYAINWVSPATAPNVRLFASPAGPGYVEAQTTYVGATITVTPAPGAAAILIVLPVCGVFAGRRRR